MGFLGDLIQKIVHSVKTTWESIPGLQYTLMRLTGNLLYIFVFLYSLWGFIKSQLLPHEAYWQILIPIIGIIPFYLTLTAPKDFIDDNRTYFLTGGIVYFILSQYILFSLFGSWVVIWPDYILLVIAWMLLMVTHHLCLVVFKGQKIAFAILTLVFEIFWCILVRPRVGTYGLLPFIIYGIATLMIFTGEFLMYRKKLLHYI
jgi:hypothetical protein